MIFTCKLSILALICCFGLSLCQTEFLFPWFGPIVVPIDGVLVTPPDFATVQIANIEGIQRELRIREDVDATIDCSLILEDFVTNNSLATDNVTVRWFVRRYRGAQQILDSTESLVEETVDPGPLDPAFIFNGSSNEILTIQRSSVPQIAREGNAGDYRCEVCETASPGNCRSGNLTLSVIAYEPVLLRSPTNYSLNSYYVGADFCILPGDPTFFLLTCSHNNSHPVTQSSITASWTLNGEVPPVTQTLIESDDSGVIDANLIVDTSNIDQILGIYRCVLMTFGGNDTATSVVTKCCEVSDIPVINGSTGFVSVQMIGIGQSTCSGRGEGPIMISCPLSSGSNVTRTWYRDGQIIENVINMESISVSQSGLYTCNATNRCGNDEQSSQIYPFPEIFSLNGSITGVVGNGCDRVGSPTTPTDLCPKPNEQITLSCGSSIDSYTISGPGGSAANSSLVISSASVYDVGQYTCTSSNQCDTSSQQFNITLGSENGNWTVGPWSECNATCGTGLRTRNVSCVGVISGNVISEDLCEGDKPSSTEACSGLSPCPDQNSVWNVGPWSECSKNCDTGKQTRNVTCEVPATQTVVDDSQCSEPRPNEMSFCNVFPCCRNDLLPFQCNFIADTDICGDPLYKNICCCTCKSYDIQM